MQSRVQNIHQPVASLQSPSVLNGPYGSGEPHVPAYERNNYPNYPYPNNPPRRSLDLSPLSYQYNHNYEHHRPYTAQQEHHVHHHPYVMEAANQLQNIHSYSRESSEYSFSKSDKPFKCDKCDISFARIHDLKRHQKKHENIKEFRCPSCKKTFARKDSLMRHVKKTGDILLGCGSKFVTHSHQPESPQPVQQDWQNEQQAQNQQVQQQQTHHQQTQLQEQHNQVVYPSLSYERLPESGESLESNAHIETAEVEYEEYNPYPALQQPKDTLFQSSPSVDELLSEIAFLKSEIASRDAIISQHEKEKAILRQDYF